MTKKQYYYFGARRVYVFTQESKNYTPLSKKQIAFYKKCTKENYIPDIQEVKECKKYATEFDLETYKEERISQLSFTSLSAAESIFPTYKRRNADLGVYKNSLELIGNEKKLVMELREEFNRVKTEITKSETREQIDNLVKTNQFEAITYKYNFKTQ